MLNRRLWGIALVALGGVLLWLAGLVFVADRISVDPVVRLVLFIFTVGLVPLTPSDQALSWAPLSLGLALSSSITAAAGVFVYRSARSLDSYEANAAEFSRAIERNHPLRERSPFQFWKYGWKTNLVAAVTCFFIGIGAVVVHQPLEGAAIVLVAVAALCAVTALAKLCAALLRRVAGVKCGRGG